MFPPSPFPSLPDGGRDGSFAHQLDLAIRRSNGGGKVIEHLGAGSLASAQREAETVSAEHQRQPIKPYKLTRRI
jgi:hypothetical protein